jgi:hypothetical protein
MIHYSLRISEAVVGKDKNIRGYGHFRGSEATEKIMSGFPLAWGNVGL